MWWPHIEKLFQTVSRSIESYPRPEAASTARSATFVRVSPGSFDNDHVRETYRALVAIRDNDIAQVHRYLDLGAELPVCHGPVDVLAADAVRELWAFDPRKPVLLAESGAVEPEHTGPFKLYWADSAGVILHDVLFAPFFAGAAGPGQIWHWNNYVDAMNLWFHFGRFAEAVDGIDPPAERFEPLELPHERLRLYALLGQKTLLLWCRDRLNDWRSELERREAPPIVHGLRLDLSGLRLHHRAVTRVYDPWKNKWIPVKAQGDILMLPDFSRSVVVRVDIHE